MRDVFQLRLSFDREATAITISSTLLLMVDAYHRLTPIKYLDRLGLYLVIPLGMIVLAFRRSPREYGFTLGDWRAGLIISAAAMAAIAPILWSTARGDAAMHEYYRARLDPLMPVENLLDLLGWEFFFRGFILFGYARRYGDDALWLQAVPFALAHIGKPEVETLSTIFGGFAFGLIAWRTRSFVYPLLVHWFVATFTVLAAGGVLG